MVTYLEIRPSVGTDDRTRWDQICLDLAYSQWNWQSSDRCEASSHHYLTAPLGQVIASSPRDHRLQHGRRPPFKPLRVRIIVTDTEAQPQNDILDFDLSLTCLCLWKKSSDNVIWKISIKIIYYAHSYSQQANILHFNRMLKDWTMKTKTYK